MQRNSVEAVATRERYIHDHYRAFWLAGLHHVTHRNRSFDLKAYPYMRAVLLDPSRMIVGKKSTQGGWTELFMVKTMAALDEGLSVFAVYPTEVLRNRFVRNRFDRSTAFTPYYRKRITDEQTKRLSQAFSASVSLKHFGKAAIAFIGSGSISAFGEFPADVLLVDEYDNCDQANLPMAEERLSNSEHRIKWLIGNPTIEGFGISKLYGDSDQCRWHIQCEHCEKFIRPEWMKHVVRKIDDVRFEVLDPDWEGPGGPEAKLICDKCEKPIDRFGKGEWVIENPHGSWRGYHVSKLFSTKMTINEMLDRFDNGLFNPTLAKRFWNGDMGEAFEAKGAKVQIADLQECVGDYAQGPAGGPCFVGVDVGAVMHVVIGQQDSDGSVRVVWIGTVPGQLSLADLRLLMSRFIFRAGVIDEMPETRLSRRLAYSSRRWWMCRYVGGKRDMFDPRSKVVSVDRTAALDAVNELIMLGPTRFKLPGNALSVPDFLSHMTALTRVFDQELNRGEGGYVWAGDQPDHYLHAMGYMLLARRLVIRR